MNDIDQSDYLYFLPKIRQKFKIFYALTLINILGRFYLLFTGKKHKILPVKAKQNFPLNIIC